MSKGAKFVIKEDKDSLNSSFSYYIVDLHTPREGMNYCLRYDLYSNASSLPIFNKWFSNLPYLNLALFETRHAQLLENGNWRSAAKLISRIRKIDRLSHGR